MPLLLLPAQAVPATGTARPARAAALRWLPPAGFLTSAVFAVLVALLSDEPVHRLWGAWAAAGYGLAALVALAAAAGQTRPRRGPGWPAGPPDAARQRAWGRALAVALTGAVLVPLGVLASAGRGMPEVGVTERAAALLLQHGSPYLPAARLAGHGFLAYNPYLPAMSLFGLPHAVAGPGLLTDPRLWAGLVFTAAALAAFRTAGLAWRACAAATAVLVASPVIAFPLAVSGNDIPVLGLVLLGLALASTASPGDLSVAPGTPATRAPARRTPAGRSPRAVPKTPIFTSASVVWSFASATLARLKHSGSGAVAAGAVLGLAAAMKATAWPAVAVAGALLAGRDGWRAAARAAVTAAAVFAAVLLPWLITAPDALLRNTVLFPLGLTSAPSPAASPLPGHLLAAAGPAGHVTAVLALAAAAIVPAVLLVLRPPRTGAAAVRRLAGWLALLFALAPDSRWGYFCYPAGLAAWLWLRDRPWLTGRPGRAATGSGQRGEDVTDRLAAAGVERDLHPGVPAGLGGA